MVAEVIKNNQKLVKEQQWTTLCQTLAKEAVFGINLMRTHTPSGGGKSADGRALPVEGMELLKQTMFQFFPRFHGCPHMRVEMEKLLHSNRTSVWTTSPEVGEEPCFRANSSKQQLRQHCINTVSITFTSRTLT